MSSIEGKGIQWMAMPCKVISDTGILGVSRGDQLDISSFKKVIQLVSLGDDDNYYTSHCMLL